MVDAKVEPSLPRNLPLPVAAGVIIDQLLLLWHHKQFPKLRARLLKLVSVVILLDIMVLVVLGDDTLEQTTSR